MVKEGSSHISQENHLRPSGPPGESGRKMPVTRRELLLSRIAEVRVNLQKLEHPETLANPNDSAQGNADNIKTAKDMATEMLAYYQSQLSALDTPPFPENH